MLFSDAFKDTPTTAPTSKERQNTVSQSKIKLYYKNVMADVIGPEHGITADKWEDLAEQTKNAIKQVNEKRRLGETPFRDLPTNTENLNQVNQVVENVKDHCENLVVLGIGGSALGNIALQTSLNPPFHNLDRNQRTRTENGRPRALPRLFIFDNVDPDQFASFLHWLGEKLERTVFNVISKSGRTTETVSQFMTIRELLGGPESERYRKSVVITTEHKNGNTLLEIARKEDLHNLELTANVGGRFSVLSAVGLFTAALCGMDTKALLAGAEDMDARVSKEDFLANPAAINAAINYHFYNRGKKISVMMPYSYALKDWADWYRQLWAESLGKYMDSNGNKLEIGIGPTPVKALGATDQHSQVQLYREGPNDKLFTFLQVNSFHNDITIGPAPQSAPELEFLAGKTLGDLLNNEKNATEYALLEDNRPCLTVLFDRVNEYTVGQFIYLYEVTTSITAALFGINAYDQPAVELGKEATFALMGKPGDYEPADGGPPIPYARWAEQIRPRTDIDDAFLV